VKQGSGGGSQGTLKGEDSMFKREMAFVAGRGKEGKTETPGLTIRGDNWRRGCNRLEQGGGEKGTHQFFT